MEEKLSGIVVGRTDFSENDKILKIFTLEKGMVSAKIKGVKKAGAKLKFAAEPFCFSEYVFSLNGEKRTVIGASLIESFFSIRQDILKFFCASAVIEYVRKFMKEGMVSEKLFALTVNALKELAYGDKEGKTVTARFFLSALTLSGYGLDFSGCANCGKEIKERVFFDALSGGFYCEDCRADNVKEMSFLTYDILKRITEGEDFSDEVMDKPLKLIDYYVTHKADEKIKSFASLLGKI